MYKPNNYYTLFRKDGIFYYACYDEDGKRVQRSTGRKRKGEAVDVINDRIANGRLVYPVGYSPKVTVRKVSATSMTFKEYTADFYVYDRCPIIQDTLARGGHFSKDFAKITRQNMEKHLYPAFGSHVLSEITQGEVNAWLLNLPSLASISPTTANKVYRILRDVMDRAVFDGIISRSPCDNVKNLKPKKKEERHSFTDEEVRRITHSTHCRYQMSLVAFRIASSTGMRKSEIRALMPDHVFRDHILVEYSFAKETGLKCTKSNVVREVPISEDLYNDIMSVCHVAKGFIFSLDGEKPVNDKFFNNELQLAMEGEGIDRPGLVFHSFRYYVNSKLVTAGIPNDVIQSIIGHSSDEMTSHYFDIDLSRKRELCLATLTS